MSEVFFNPFDPAFHDNRYAMYRRILDEAPVHRSPLGGWVLARYSDVQTVLRRPDMTTRSLMMSNDEREALLRAQGMWEQWSNSALPAFMDVVMLLQDPPEHTRLRAVMGKVFTPKAVEGLRPHIEELVSDLLAEVDGEMELIADLAFPLPALVICEMLGIPSEDREQLKVWSSAAARLLDPLMDSETFQRADDALKAFREYFFALIDERHRSPGDDLFSTLVHDEEDGERLTDDELVTNGTFLFGAGHETTQNLIGNGVNALLRNPDQLEKLRADPSLVRNAIEEFLRYDPPVQVTGRSAMSEVELPDVTIEAGERVILLLAAANRDPARFDDPDRLDITRPDLRPLSFGGGIHHCLGAALARLEGQVAISGLLDRFGTIELVTDKVEWKDNITLRGPKELRLRVSV